MFAKTRSMARKYGARIAAAPAALLVGFSAQAAEGDNALTQITAKVNEAMTSGATIATAIVIGLFVIWAIKLLWRSK